MGSESRPARKKVEAPEVGFPVPLQDHNEWVKLISRAHLLWVLAQLGGYRSVLKEVVPRFDVY